MKHIGIVDITTVGACICANAIVAEAARRDPTGAHPEFTMHSFSFKEYKTLVLAKNWGDLAELVLTSIRKLRAIGAEFVIIPSNTPHYAIEKIQRESPIPVLNLIEITVSHCLKNGFLRVAILGTKATMEDGLYAIPLDSTHEISPVIPSESLRNRIHNLIIHQIIPSTIDYEEVQAIADELKKLECDVFILGCTELPVVFNEKNLFKPVIDTTSLLGYEALNYSTQNTVTEEKEDTLNARFKHT